MKGFNKTLTTMLLTVLVGVIFPMEALAQHQKVSGSVTDPKGEAIIGATVTVKGNMAKGATITDINGRFTIDVPSDGTLIVSYIGYTTQDVPVKGRQQIAIVLEESNKMLDELVVVGYGMMKKSDLTGSVGSLGSKDINNSSVNNIGSAIQGKISGVQIVDAGKPGDNVNIKIRGLGSINNCDPLVVIDGVPTDLGLNAINMNDVDRLDILKDASATAIYGSRGANGVVMITTKRGTEGKNTLSVSANASIQNATNVPHLLNAAQYAALSNEMMVNSGRTPNPEFGDFTSLGQGTDWMNELLHTGVMQNYTISYSGGNEKSHYYISGGLLDQSGIIKSVDYRRFTFQVNTDSQVTKWLKFSNNLTFSADEKKQGAYSISDAMKSLPTQPVKNVDGTWSGPEGNAEWYGSIRNPIGTTEVNHNKTNGYNFLANITAELRFAKWLKFRSTFGYDAKFWFDDNYTPKYNWKPIPVEESSRYKSTNKSFTYLWDNYFLFDYTIGSDHNLSVMAGMSAQWNNYDYYNAQKNVFQFDNVHEFDNGEKMYSMNGNLTEWSLLSYMGRLNYSYKNRYLLTATVRRDGSSKFGPKHRWGTFPSASAAWRITQEKWFPKIKFLDDLKIRIGYGVTGSQASVGSYGYLAQYNTGKYPIGISGTDQTVLYASSLANPYIHWEEVAQSNFGIDTSFFGSRIMLSLDAYIKNTRDMLVKASIPITSGFEDTSTTYTNAGRVSNKGIELTLHTVNLEKALRWETAISTTYNRNKIKDLNSSVPYYINQVNNSYVTMLANGYPINIFYGYVTDGIFQNQQEVNRHAIQAGAEPGDIRFRDLNNDGVINDIDRTVLGNPNPIWMFSMNNTLTYKRLEFSIYLQGVTGNKIFNANNIDNTGMAAAYNQTTDVLQRWTGEGTSTFMPRAVYGDPNNNNRISDRFVENGSYLRLKNITLAYNFPKQQLKKLGMDSVRLSFSCENIATITTYSGFDPEVDINGIDFSRYPISRTLSLGLNFNF